MTGQPTIAERRTRRAWNRDTAAVMFVVNGFPRGRDHRPIGRVVGA